MINVNEKIITAIDRFIDERNYNYALLINGRWGCGKTYFVENTLIPHIHDDLNKDVSR